MNTHLIRFRVVTQSFQQTSRNKPKEKVHKWKLGWILSGRHTKTDLHVAKAFFGPKETLPNFPQQQKMNTNYKRFS